MEIILRPGDLQNGNYRLNIPIMFRGSIENSFATQPIIIILNHETVVEIPNDNLTYVNWHALADARISAWLHEIHAVPYEAGNPPEISFSLVNTSRCNFLIHNQ